MGTTYKIRFAFFAIFFLGLGVGLANALDQAPPMKGKIDITYVSGEEVAEKLSSEDKTLGFHLVDLRIEAEYQKGFIPGAINIPFKKLSFVAEKLFTKSDEIVFYSHAKTEHVSENAVIFMQNKGFFNSAVLKGGFDDWEGDLETGGKG